MDKEYFYEMGKKEGIKLIEEPKSYEEALITKTENIFEKYGKECAEAYRRGILSILVPYKEIKAR